MNRLFLFLCMATFGASVVASDKTSGSSEAAQSSPARGPRDGGDRFYMPPARRTASEAIDKGQALLSRARSKQATKPLSVAGPSTPATETPLRTPQKPTGVMKGNTWYPNKPLQLTSEVTEPVSAPSFDPAPTLDFSGVPPVIEAPTTSDAPKTPVVDVTPQETASSVVEPNIASPVDTTPSSSFSAAPTEAVDASVDDRSDPVLDSMAAALSPFAFSRETSPVSVPTDTIESDSDALVRRWLQGSMPQTAGGEALRESRLSEMEARFNALKSGSEMAGASSEPAVGRPAITVYNSSGVPMPAPHSAAGLESGKGVPAVRRKEAWSSVPGFSLPAPTVARPYEPKEERVTIKQDFSNWKDLSDKQRLLLRNAIRTVTAGTLTDFFKQMKEKNISFAARQKINVQKLKNLESKLSVTSTVPVSSNPPVPMSSIKSAEWAKFKSSNAFTPALAGVVPTWSPVESLPTEKLKAALGRYARYKNAKDFVHILGVIARYEKAVLSPADIQKYEQPESIQALANKLGVDLEPTRTTAAPVVAFDAELPLIPVEYFPKAKLEAALLVYAENKNQEDFVDTLNAIARSEGVVLSSADNQKYAQPESIQALANKLGVDLFVDAPVAPRLSAREHAKSRLPDSFVRGALGLPTDPANVKPVAQEEGSINVAVEPEKSKEVVAPPFDLAPGFETSPSVLRPIKEWGNADQDSFKDAASQSNSPTNVTAPGLDDVVSGGNEPNSAKPNDVADVTAVDNNVGNNANAGDKTPPVLTNDAISTMQSEKKDYSKWEVGGGALGLALATAIFKSVSPAERGALFSRLKSRFTPLKSDTPLTRKEKWAALRVLGALAAAAAGTFAAGHGLYTMATKKNEAAAGN